MNYTVLVVKIFFFFQAEDGIRDYKVTGVQTCALPISKKKSAYTLHELEIEIADWVVNHYHVHKHGALMKPPLIVWEEKILGTDGAMAAGLPIQIADPEKLKLEIGRAHV